MGISANYLAKKFFTRIYGGKTVVMADGMCISTQYLLPGFFLSHSSSLVNLYKVYNNLTIYRAVFIPMGFPGGARGNEPACQWRSCGFDFWVCKVPWRKKWQPDLVFLLGKSHGQRSLVGYSLWVPKGQTWLSMHTHTSCLYTSLAHLDKQWKACIWICFPCQHMTLGLHLQSHLL